jgi:hypothetical protein
MARPGALSAPVLTRRICKRIILLVMMRAALPRYVPLRWDKQRKRARKGCMPPPSTLFPNYAIIIPICFSNIGGKPGWLHRKRMPK